MPLIGALRSGRGRGPTSPCRAGPCTVGVSDGVHVGAQFETAEHTREASAMAARMAATSASRRSNGAQISTASCTGAQTSIPRSVARQHASRSISAPFACIGKLRSDRGLGFSPTCTCHPNTVCSGAGRAWRRRAPHPTSARTCGRSRGACAAARARRWWVGRSAAPTLRLPCRTARPGRTALNSSRCGPCVAWWLRRDRTGLLCERQIRIAGSVGRLHVAVAGQRRRDAEFLLRPIHIGDAVPGGGLIRPRSQTDGPKYEFRIARLIAAGAAAERRQYRAIAAVLADGEIVEPQFRQTAAQFAIGRHQRISFAICRKVSSLKSSCPLSSRGQGMPWRASSAAQRSALKVRPS